MTQELVNKLAADAYLSKEEAAQYWGSSTKTVERAMAAGLPHYLITSRPHFKKNDLDIFAQQFRRKVA